jgi:hypothetical protein
MRICQPYQYEEGADGADGALALADGGADNAWLSSAASAGDDAQNATAKEERARERSVVRRIARGFARCAPGRRTAKRAGSGVTNADREFSPRSDQREATNAGAVGGSATKRYDQDRRIGDGSAPFVGLEFV